MRFRVQLALSFQPPLRSRHVRIRDDEVPGTAKVRLARRGEPDPVIGPADWSIVVVAVVDLSIACACACACALVGIGVMARSRATGRSAAQVPSPGAGSVVAAP